MKTSSDYVKATSIVRREVAAWDPYALLDGGAPDDEFEAEVSLIVAGLRGVGSVADLASVMSKIFSSRFGDESFSPESCMGVASRIYAALQSSGVLVPNNSLQARRP